MSRYFDVIVAGLGAMGGAACDHLAERGLRVLGLDRFSPPHLHGSSHGESRIIREAYFEDPRYVPLVRRAYECWHALERDTRSRLLQVTGGLMIGPPDGEIVSGALKSAKEHGLPHQLWTAAELRARHPEFAIGEEHVAVWEPRAGFLNADACVTAQLERAARRGADLRPNTPVTAWRSTGSDVEVHTARGVERAEALVLAAGAWMPELIGGVPLELSVERMVLYWFEPARGAESFALGRFPIWIWEHERGRTFYGFPLHARGLKVARHHEGEICTPETARRDVSADEISAMRDLLALRLPAAAGPLRETATCLYTNTTDQHFVLDRHPDHENVLIASPCSGHGFKFANAIGEVLADLVTAGRSRFDLAPFRLARFGLPRAGA